MLIKLLLGCVIVLWFMVLGDREQRIWNGFTKKGFFPTDYHGIRALETLCVGVLVGLSMMVTLSLVNILYVVSVFAFGNLCYRLVMNKVGHNDYFYFYEAREFHIHIWTISLNMYHYWFSGFCGLVLSMVFLVFW